MKFNVNQKELQEALSYCQGVIEKRSTLPILSNILLDASESKLTITATDLDLIFIHQINNVEILEEGRTTTTSSIMYDIVRKFSPDKKINLFLNSDNKLQLESEKSIFNLNCINSSEFPLTDENFNQNEFVHVRRSLAELPHEPPKRPEDPPVQECAPAAAHGPRAREAHRLPRSHRRAERPLQAPAPAMGALPGQVEPRARGGGSAPVAAAARYEPSGKTFFFFQPS